MPAPTPLAPSFFESMIHGGPAHLLPLAIMIGVVLIAIFRRFSWSASIILVALPVVLGAILALRKINQTKLALSGGSFPSGVDHPSSYIRSVLSESSHLLSFGLVASFIILVTVILQHSKTPPSSYD